jgi:hypothetical protein
VVPLGLRGGTGIGAGKVGTRRGDTERPPRFGRLWRKSPSGSHFARRPRAAWPPRPPAAPYAAPPPRPKEATTRAAPPNSRAHVCHEELLALVEAERLEDGVDVKLAPPRQRVCPHLEGPLLLVVAGPQEAQEGVEVCIGREGERAGGGGGRRGARAGCGGRGSRRGARGGRGASAARTRPPSSRLPSSRRGVRARARMRACAQARRARTVVLVPPQAPLLQQQPELLHLRLLRRRGRGPGRGHASARGGRPRAAAMSPAARCSAARAPLAACPPLQRLARRASVGQSPYTRTRTRMRARTCCSAVSPQSSALPSGSG